ncbi:MAG TPA: thiosulfate oxidation carrier complex protein SoxZ [Ferrovibrio sp.]|uniref:thiosulfate oxidation carrier complex protein SoxZ n=1 Tax=Ferrovibrio sp. TaxID=1917215 RepID=UPI002ED236C4
MADVKPRIRVPSEAKKGEVIEVKTLISHPMESGQRKDSKGQLIPRKIINKMSVTYNGKTVFEAKLEPAISANPYISFYMKATESGEMAFAWTDDDGSVYKATQQIKVA